MQNVFDFFEKWGLDKKWVLFPAGFVMLIVLAWLYEGEAPVIGVAFSWAFFFAPIWLPVLLIAAGWPLWLHYVRTKFIASQKVTLLEIRIPRDILKSPRAMELVFDGLAYGGGEGTFINRNIEGRVRQWWSFEMVSIGGQIHLYIWTRAGMRDMVETQLYAHYPGIEIYEVDDYATRFHFDPATTGAWGCDFIKNPKKPKAMPLKTYADYELDKNPDEENKVDPIAHIYESLSALKPGEQIWLQIMFRQSKEDLSKEVQETIKKIRDDATPKYTDAEGNERTGFTSLTKAQEEQINAMGRALGKNAFDIGMRTVYLYPKDAFNSSRIQMLTGLWRAFGSGNLNNLQPTRWFTTFNWPWQDWFISKDGMAEELVDAYKRRSWFWPPYKEDPFVMTSEELATICHFPSSTIQAPGLARIPATKAEAPSNLPV
ncbi:MAG TPA: hypothetical protein VFL98_00530 [Candidatus Paceibacterota bacterium]|nr:hypothetical protein [Candidatus Paceibacterota bacterium]